MTPHSFGVAWLPDLLDASARAQEGETVDARTAEGSTLERPARHGAVGTESGERFDPGHVLGCSGEEAQALFHGRRVTPGEAEAIAERVYPWRRHLHDPSSYWVTVSEASRLLQLSPARVRRLLDQNRLPHVVHASGARLMRRRQIEAIAKWRLSSTASAPSRAGIRGVPLGSGSAASRGVI